MFQKLIGKRKKQADFFHIPEKKYTCDQKIISKMGASALKDLFSDQEKYVATLIEKLEHAKIQYDRLTDKVDEMQQKNEVVNAQIARMTNQHEQLTIKFDNLQTSLEIVSSETDLIFKKELAFLNEQEVNCEKIKNLNAVLTFYRERAILCKKIEQQNRSLKSRFTGLEDALEEAQAKIQEFEKEKNYNNLIPSLMQEIQELRENNAKAESKKQQDLQNHLSKLEEKLVHKVKNELETVSTLKTAEEEDNEERIRQTALELQRANQELLKNQSKIKQLEQKCQELIFNCGKASERILFLEAELSKSKQAITRCQEEKSAIISKCQQIQDKLNKEMARSKGLEQQLTQQKASGNNLEDFLAQINTVLESKQAQCSKLHEELQIKEHIISSKDEEINREKENRESIERLLSSKSSSETEGLMKIKAKNQAEIQELRQTNDAFKRSITQGQAKIKQISDEIQLLKSANKRLAEQKQMIQENANNCLKISQEESEKIKNLQKQSNRRNEEFKKELQAAASKMKLKQDEVKNLTTQTQKLFKTLQLKEAELKKNYACIQELEKEKNNINMIIGQKEQDNKIRIRKFESELNQERIKNESLTRKINNLESKAEESKVSMDNMYEQLLAKDKKIVHMQTKLKQYKYIIQVQKKEKQELEQSYQKTLSTIKPSSIERVEPVEIEKKLNAEENQIDHQKQNLANELLSIKEQNIVLLSENEGLRKKIEDLEDTVKQKSRNIKILQEKRDQIMKEIQKMNRNPATNPKEQVNLHSLPSPTAMVTRLDSKQQQSRQKKIAAKAHKGFDILLKLQHQFYKNFINIFAVELNRQEVKAIEGEINTIINKSSDMKDIFEDYL